MEENEDSILLEVKLEENNLEGRVKVLKGELEALKQQKKDLDTLNKSGVVTGKAYADQLEEIEKRTKSAKTELQGHTRTLDLQQKAQKAANGSIAQLRANVSLLTAQYVELSAEERDATDAGQQLGQQLTEQIAKLKALEKAYGDNRREVGNYALANKEAAKESSSFSSFIVTASDSLSTFTSSLPGLSEQLETVKGGFDAVKTGTEGARVGLTGIKAAIASTGIGLLIVALGALYSFLTRTQEGMDFVERKTKAISAVFGLLANKAAALGKILFDAIRNPKQAMIDLGEAIQNNVVKRLEGFRVIAQGIINLDFEKIANGFVQVGTGIEDATGKAKGFAKEIGDVAARAEALATANQRIRRAESQIEVQRSKSRAQIEGLKKLAEDETKSNSVRAKAAQDAYTLEQNLLRSLMKLRLEAVQLAREEERLSGQRTEESQKKINDALKEYYEVQEDSLGKQTELQNQLNQIRKDGADKAREQAEQELTRQVQLAQLRLETARLSGQDTLKLEEALLRKQAQQEAFGLKKNSELRKAIEAKTNAEITTLRINHAAELQQKALELRNAELSATLAIVRRGSREELELTIQALRISGQQRELEARKQYRNDVEFEQARAAIVLQTQRQIDDARTAFGRGEIERVAELGQLRIQTEIDLNNTSIDNDRILAERRIDLEEKTQLELLEIAEISEEERLVRMNAIQAKAVAERREVYKQLREDERAQTQALLDIRLASVKKGTVEELKLKKEQMAVQMKAELDNLKLTEEQKEAIRAKYREQEEEAVDAFNESVAANTIESAARATQVATTLIEASIARRTAVLDKQQKAALASAGLNADLRAKVEETFQKRREKLEKDAAKKRQRIASIENVINTAKAVTVALTGAPPPFNAILAAIAGAQGLAQQVLIDSQQFARGGVYLSDGRGGYVRGPGTATSDSINSRLSNGESVNNAESTKLFYPLYSLLNQLGGGKPYPNTPTYSPAMLSSAGGPSIDPAALKTAVSEALREMPRPVVYVSDMNKVQSQVKAVEVLNDL